MTLRELTGHLWYVNEIVVVKQKDIDHNTDYTKEAFVNKALFADKAYKMQSVIYDSLNEYVVKNYGVIDDALIVEV